MSKNERALFAREPNRAGKGVASLLMAGVASLTLSVPAGALTVTGSFGAGVSAQAQAAFNFAASEFQNLYSDPINVNINVVAGNTGLGGSSTPLLGILNYTQTRQALIDDNTAHPSAAGNTSVGPGGSIFTPADPSTTGRYFFRACQRKGIGADSQ
jgi:hypothetical protein